MQNPGSLLTIKITPRSPRNEIQQILENGTIKIRLTAPPVDGKANQALIEFLSEKLGVPRNNIKIISGQTSHTKIITIGGIEKDELIARIHGLV